MLTLSAVTTLLLLLGTTCALSAKAATAAKDIALSDSLNMSPALRYRFQDVQDSLRGDASANTLKLRMSLDWQASENIQLFSQFDYVHAFNNGEYNSVTVAQNTSPIPEPESHEINQLFLHYNSNVDWYVRIGRQSLSFDNERHIGTNAFWQHDQSFDAVNFVYNDNINWQLSYVYLAGVQRIFGTEAKRLLSLNDVRFPAQQLRPEFELGYHEHRSHLFNARYTFSNQFSVSSFAYLLNNRDEARFSSNTLGVRATGEHKPKQIKYAYEFEFAIQKDAHNSPWNYQTSYVQAQVSAQFKSHKFSLNHERFGEDNGFSFATSLDSAHKFNGWADIFDDYFRRDGITDTFIDYRGRDSQLRWRVKLHQFNDLNDGGTIGHELDLELAYRYSRKIELRLIAARYNSDKGIERLPISQSNLTTLFASISYNL